MPITFPNLSTTSYHPILIISHNAILLTSYIFLPRFLFGSLHPWPIPARRLSASAAWKRLLSSAERISAKPRRIAGMISWESPCDVFFGPKISGCVKCVIYRLWMVHFVCQYISLFGRVNYGPKKVAIKISGCL